MGVGPSAKETTIHHFRDPLLEVVSSDEDFDLLGVMLYGSSDKYAEKMLASKRAAVWAQGMRADGALIFCEGSGNNHVDFAHACEELGKRGVAVAGLTVLGKNGQFVVLNEHLDAIVDVCKSKGSVEPCVVGMNNMTFAECRKAAALLKLKMRKMDRERKDRPL